MVRRYVWSRNLVNKEAMAHWGGGVLRQKQKMFIQQRNLLHFNTGSSKKMDGIWNRYNLKSTRRIYTFGVLKCSEKFKVLDLP